MTHEMDYTEFIERYLQNEMTSTEKAWFEKELEGNQVLQDEVIFHRKIDSVLSDKDMIAFKAQLDEIHEEIHETTQKGRKLIRKSRHKANIAISAIASLAILISIYIPNRNYSNEEITGLYYQPVQSAVSFRSSDNQNNKLAEAMTLYENKDYAKAIDVFESILLEDNSKLGVNLYSGISYMELNEYEAATTKFTNILDEAPNPFVESARWYIGLCYLFTEDIENAKESFSLLVTQDSYYKKDAKKILRRL